MPAIPDRLKGKIAVVTGGGNGIGTGICERLAAEGAMVWVLDIDGSAASQAAALLAQKGLMAQSAEVDTSNEAQTADWDRVLSVNVKGYSFMIKHAARLLKTNGGTDKAPCGGSIINIASISGWIGQPGFGPYSASKGAVLQLSKCAAIDLGKYGIRVNTICPGPIFTEGTKRHAAGAGQTVDELVAEMTSHMIMHRMGNIEEVAAAVSFLASDDSSFITASNLVVDGGYTAL
ncbi:hypothetical protein WJX84_007111 [Apatococcus fuscideae]|uniref:Uncharacterized protein n=1 Tax=Apatococcus fuscideae TaxID=2026836 RepID=A0AAW1SSM7_9CHLO